MRLGVGNSLIYWLARRLCAELFTPNDRIRLTDPIRGVAGLGGVWWKRFQNVFVQCYYWVGLEVDIVE